MQERVSPRSLQTGDCFGVTIQRESYCVGMLCEMSPIRPYGGHLMVFMALLLPYTHHWQSRKDCIHCDKILKKTNLKEARCALLHGLIGFSGVCGPEHFWAVMRQSTME